MFNKTRMIATATFLTGVFFSPVGFTNDLELLATTIPASACRPSSDSQDALIRLSNGAFIFRAGQTGTASLLCPLPVNGWRVSVSVPDQFVDPDMNMTSYRIYYRDPATCSSSVRVRARLRYRDESGMQNVSPWWNSTNEVEGGSVPGFCTPGIETNTSEEVPVNHMLPIGRLYHFLVQITRDTDTANPVFTGIDFPSNFHVEG